MYTSILPIVNCSAASRFAPEGGGFSASWCVFIENNIDGKTICESKNSKHFAYHVVSAWVAETHITLGELAVDEKSNEITAIPELLDLIDVKGDIVTIDAIGCQTDIAAKIREAGADYVLALKDNQPALNEDVSDYFDWVEWEQPKSESVDICKSKPEKGHGRIETREILTAPALPETVDSEACVYKSHFFMELARGYRYAL